VWTPADFPKNSGPDGTAEDLVVVKTATKPPPELTSERRLKGQPVHQWLKEHAWKTKRATDTEPRRSTLTHTDQRLNLPDRLLSVRR
jgi:hypothetical protein